MKKNNFYFIVLLVFLMTSLSFSQECDWKPTPEIVQFQKFYHKKIKNANKSNTAVSIPVFVAVINKTNGNPSVSVNKINQLFSEIASKFQVANITFYIADDILYVPNGQRPEFPNHKGKFLRLIFDPDLNSNICGSALGLRLKIRATNSCMVWNVLAHEFGHNLGLRHTHGPTNNGTTTELVDGSNCTTNGDGFCDTPADPNLSSKVNGACVYTGNATDANGDTYMPLTDNIMSYSRYSCIDNFTQEQNDYINAFANTAKYSYCDLDFASLTESVQICLGSTATLTASGNGNVTWYAQREGGPLLASGNSFTTPVINNSSTFYVTLDNGSCNLKRVPVYVEIIPDTAPINFSETTIASSPQSIRNPVKFNGNLYFNNYEGDLLELKPGSTIPTIIHTFPEGSISKIFTDGTTLFIGISNSGSAGSNSGGGSKVELHAFNNITQKISLLREWSNANSSFEHGFANNILYFGIYNEGRNGVDLWIYKDNTTFEQLDNYNFNLSSFTKFNDKMYFAADKDETGTELWVSDGTQSGTQIVKDIEPGINSSINVYNFKIQILNNQLYFIVKQHLWVSDGTTNGTQPLLDADQTGILDISGLTKQGDYLFFNGNSTSFGNEPYISDGTVSGTSLLSDIATGTAGSSAREFTLIGDDLYLAATKEIFDSELYKININTKIATLVKNINVETSSSPRRFVAIDNLLYFIANTSNGNRAFVSNGSSAGTYAISQFNATGIFDQAALSFDNRLFFIFFNDNGGVEFTALQNSTIATCPGDQATLTVSNANGNTVHWYETLNSQTPVFTGETFTSLKIYDGTSYYASFLVDDCESGRTEFPVSIVPASDSVNCGDYFGVSIHNLTANQEFGEGSTVPIEAVISNGDVKITSVDFYVDDIKIGSNAGTPFNYNATGLALGNHQVKVIAFDKFGYQATSVSIDIIITSTPCSLSLSQDTTVTQNASCGNADGSVGIIVTGSANYNLVWKDANMQTVAVNDSKNPTNLVKGVYTITVTDTTNCSQQITVAVDEDCGYNDIILYPNPIKNGYLNLTGVTTKGLNISDLEVALFQVNGQFVSNILVNNIREIEKDLFAINLKIPRNLASNLYHLKVKDNKNLYIDSIVLIDNK